MKRDDVMAELHQDETDGNGEILNISEAGVLYHDYGSDTDTLYQFEESLTDEYVASRIKIGEFAANTGLTEQFMVNVLKAAYKDDYADAICTLAGIIVPSNEEEYWSMFESVIHTGDSVKEWYDYEEEMCGNLIGKMYASQQVILINPVSIMEKSKSLVRDYGGIESDVQDEYVRGVIMTLIHEIRHLMMDTHMFLSEDEFPAEFAAEDAVEEFTIDAYEHLPKLLTHFSKVA